MRLTIVSFVCICSLIFVTSCEDDSSPVSNKEVSAPNASDYSVKKKTGPLSDEEIRACFRTFGLNFERLSIMMPERQGITFTPEIYENGSFVGSGGIYTTFLDAGLHDVIILKIQEDNKIKFSVYKSGGGITFHPQVLKNFGASTSSVTPVERITTKKQPIYYYAANENQIEGYSFDPANFDVEDFAKKYEFAIVIYAQLKEPGSETRENKCGTSCAN